MQIRCHLTSDVIRQNTASVDREMLFLRLTNSKMGNSDQNRMNAFPKDAKRQYMSFFGKINMLFQSHDRTVI